MSVRSKNHISNGARAGGAALLASVVCSMLTGCLVAGYGTNSSDAILPGGLGLVFVLGLLLWFMLRRR